MNDALEVPFTFVRLKTLVDGGMRIEVDVAEIHQPVAFALFKTGADGTLTRKGGAANGPTENGTEKLVEACEDPRPVKKRHVSETTLKAYELCRDKEFQEYAWGYWYSPEATKRRGVLYHEKDELGARLFLLEKCGVEHRSEIDKKPESAKAFGKIVADFERWRAGNEP